MNDERIQQFDQVHTYEDLERFLHDWINFLGEGPYDTIGITNLFLACAENMRENFNDYDLESVQGHADSQQIAFLERLLDSFRKPPID